MAIVMMVEPRPKAAQVTDVMQTRLTEVRTAMLLLVVTSESCLFPI